MAKKSHQLIVIKIGSSTLTNPQGKLDVGNLRRITAETAELVKQKKQAVIVTSGAIVSGAQRLGLGKPKSIPEKQAAAAVGQSLLMRQYEKAFEESDIPVAQVLLTRDEIANRKRYLNARHCLLTLLNEGVVPIINENDAVAVDEIKIGDNDTLAALAARLVGADLLILLTDIDGFYMKTKAGGSSLVQKINEITPAVKAAAGQPSTQHGTGGMITKIQAAELCLKAGIKLAIINGRQAGLIAAAVAGKNVGTIFQS